MPRTAGATKPSFLQLLAQGGVTRPSRALVRLIELQFAPQANVVSDADGAVHLYEVVKTLPGTRTKAAFAADLGITVGWPLFSQQPTSVMGLLLSGSHVSGKSVVVKVLYAVRGAGQPLEAQVCRKLELEPWDGPEHPHCLVRATAVCMKVAEADAHVLSLSGACWAIVMPRYAATLGELAQLSLEAVAAGCARMRAALDFMHARGLVHCDVKSANVLVAHGGAWLLSDFGSCARVGEPVTSAT